MPHKRYKHSKRHKKGQPERLINATNVLNATRVPPQCPINATRYATPRPQKIIQIQLKIKKRPARTPRKHY